MQPIHLFQVDAFTDKLFHGNPAAICLLKEWFNDELLQAIAIENNLSETAFILEEDQGFHIRWFTPNGEVSLCGHATLAAGFVLFELNRVQQDIIQFSSLSGPLFVTKKADLYTLDFPALSYHEIVMKEPLAALVDVKVIKAYESTLDYLILLEEDGAVARVKVDSEALKKMPKRGLIVTSRSQDADFYSRCFYPKYNVSEDPVTGSAHCVLTPFWAELLGKKKLRAIQGSTRKGEIFCQWEGERVYLSGKCKWYLKGYLQL